MLPVMIEQWWASSEKQAFYSKLNECGISDEDYARTQNVWNSKTMYNVSDILPVADIFENFISICLQTYKLDPAWYYTNPGLGLDAMLEMTKIELQLLITLWDNRL